MKSLMKQQPLPDDGDYSMLKFPYYAAKKLDGIRGCCTPDGDFMSYTEKPFKADMQEYFAPIVEACKKEQVYLDFEVYGKGLTFQQITSYVAHPPTPMPLRLCVFDIVGRADWDHDEKQVIKVQDDFDFEEPEHVDRVKQQFNERIVRYESFCKLVDPERKYLFPLPQHPVRNEQELLEQIAEAREKQWEGLILKQFMSYYQNRRPSIKEGITYKVKFWQSVDGKIVSFKQGGTVDVDRAARDENGEILCNRRGGMLVDAIGSVGVQITSDCPYKGTVAYCSFTPSAYELRQQMKNTAWADRDKWLGLMVEVEYQAVGSKIGGTLRMPRLLRLRPDLDGSTFDEPEVKTNKKPKSFLDDDFE